MLTVRAHNAHITHGLLTPINWEDGCILRSRSFGEVGEHLEVGFYFGEEDHPDCGTAEVDTLLHSCKLRGQTCELGLVRPEQEAHVVVDELQSASHSRVVLELDVDAGLVFDEAAEVGEEEVLGRRGSTDFSMVCAMTASISYKGMSDRS